jgi:DNA polymerase III alpha subunit (gram-positive type)
MAYQQNKHKVTPYIICDFETGGLDMSVCGLAELAAVAIKGDTLEKIDEIEALFAPHKILNNNKWIEAQYTEGAAKVTGLTKEKLSKEGEDIDEFVKERLIPFLEKANVYNSKTGYKPVIVAHNAQYEVKCWQNMAAGRFDLSKYFHGQEDFYGNFAPHYIDTLDLAKLLWAPNTRQTAYKLGDIMERAGIPLIDGHRAMNDVRPTGQFLEWAIRLLRIAEKSGMLSTTQQTSVQLGLDGKEQIVTQQDRTFKFQFEED